MPKVHNVTNKISPCFVSISSLLPYLMYSQKIFTKIKENTSKGTQTKLFHIIFIQITHYFHPNWENNCVTELMWNLCESNLHVKFTCIVHMPLMLSEFLVKIKLITCEVRLTWISRRQYSRVEVVGLNPI